MILCLFEGKCLIEGKECKEVSQVLGFIWGGCLASFASTRLRGRDFYAGVFGHSISALSSNQHFWAVGMGGGGAHMNDHSTPQT